MNESECVINFLKMEARIQILEERQAEYDAAFGDAAEQIKELKGN